MGFQSTMSPRTTFSGNWLSLSTSQFTHIISQNQYGRIYYNLAVDYLRKTKSYLQMFKTFRT